MMIDTDKPLPGNIPEKGWGGFFVENMVYITQIHGLAKMLNGVKN